MVNVNVNIERSKELKIIKAVKEYKNYSDVIDYCIITVYDQIKKEI